MRMEVVVSLARHSIPLGTWGGTGVMDRDGNKCIKPNDIHVSKVRHVGAGLSRLLSALVSAISTPIVTLA
jgi:hypothetical protein